MVVSGWSAEHVLRQQQAAVSIFNEVGMGSLVSGVTQHISNGGGAFFISPDGSKEGWQASDIAAKARDEFIAHLRSQTDHFVEWALILIGGDDGEYHVLQSPNDQPEAA
jgi:hypothetical protein